MKDLKLKNIEKLTQLREEFNKVISERIQDCEREKLIEGISSLSFSKIKAIFESVVPNLINDKEGAKLTRKYVKLMKESNDLKNACRFHKLTNDRHSFTNSDMLLNESLALVKNGDMFKNLHESTKKMGEVVAECVKHCNISIEKLTELINEDNTVSNSVDYLLTNEKTINNIDEYLKNFSTVSNFISENTNKPIETIGDTTTEDMVAQLTENTNSLDEQWEKTLIEDVTLMYLSNGKESDLFENYINKCINSIDIILEDEKDVATISKMSQMKEQLSSKKYIKENFSIDIKNLAELNYTLKESIN